MSLWLTVTHPGSEEAFSWNLTGNLRPMLEAAGLECFWELIGSSVPVFMLQPKVNRALLSMMFRPAVYKQHDAPNGWGTWEQLLPMLALFHEALDRAQDGEVRISG